VAISTIINLGLKQMEFMEGVTIFWSVIGLIIFWLSSMPAYRAKSWRRFFLDIFLSVIGIVFPLFIFLMSALLLPDWKGACKHGWLDCFHIGKLALSPLVIWASAAFYVVQILRPESPPRKWVHLGLLIGTMTSSICLIVGVVIHDLTDDWSIWLLVPLYVSVWYYYLSFRSFQNSELRPFAYLITFTSSLLFWIAAAIWSKKYYHSLPDTPPSCFVVTAAQSGHEFIVGPFLNIERRGELRFVNSQLVTFWQFERLWSLSCPRIHGSFRRFYNWIGPQIAARVNSLIVADLVYLMLKPLELIAAVVVRFNEKIER
jgi:hypothetical protein